MIYLILFILCCYAAKDLTTHTPIYLSGNFDDIILDYTYGLLDDCEIIYDNRIFKKHLPACKGNKWCTPKWKSNKSGYYQVEHIIDKSNSIWPKCNKAIAGNMVMVYSKYNQQIGQRTWSIVEEEKKAIYGKIYYRAKHAVYKCCNKEYVASSYISVIIYIVVLFICLIFFLREYGRTRL